MTRTKHGYPGYRNGCRCDLCRKGNARRVKAYRLRGATTTTDIAPLVTHINRLRAAGMTRKQIATLAQTNLSAIDRLVYNITPRTRINSAVASRILAIQPNSPAPYGTTTAIPTRRRIQALMVMGWSQTVIAQRTGYNQSTITRIIRGYQSEVHNATHDKIAALYDEISMLHGPSTRARDYAISRKWLPPLAWDDIDDPSEQPPWYSTVHWSVIKGERRRRSRRTSTPPTGNPTPVQLP